MYCFKIIDCLIQWKKCFSETTTVHGHKYSQLIFFPPNGNKTLCLKTRCTYKYCIWLSPAEEHFQANKAETDKKPRGIGKQQWEETIMSE